MSTTRKKRIIEGARNLTKRKRDLILDKHPNVRSCFSRWFCKTKKNSVLVYPLETDGIDEKIPDFYFKNRHFKALAHEKLGMLEACFSRGELSMVAYEYMMLGYTSILESRYMDAVAYLNKGLAWV